MAYTNDIEQIRGGLINYIGTIFTALPKTYSAEYKKQYITSILANEIFSMSQEDPGKTPCSPYILVPVLKVISRFLEQQQVELLKAPTAESKELVIEYEQCITVLNNIVKENTPETVA